MRDLLRAIRSPGRCVLMFLVRPIMNGGSVICNDEDVPAGRARCARSGYFVTGIPFPIPIRSERSHKENLNEEQTDFR